MTIHEPVSANGPVITSPIVDSTDPQPVVVTPVVDNTPAPVIEADPVVPPVVADPAADPTDPNAIKATPEWAQKRINELTAKRYEAERVAKQEKEARTLSDAQNAELLRQLAAKGTVSADGTTTTVTPAAKPGPTQAEIDTLVATRAAELAQAERFTNACNVVADEGKREYKDWDEALRNLTLVGALGKDVSPEFLETAVELRSPHKILHHLGKNLEEAERIVNLPPKRMAMEMARIEAQLNSPTVPVVAPVSQAPAPVIPVGGAAKVGAVDVNDTTTPIDDWMAQRQKQMDERRKRYQRV